MFYGIRYKVDPDFGFSFADEMKMIRKQLYSIEEYQKKMTSEKLRIESIAKRKSTAQRIDEMRKKKQRS